jgi:hypothetical protein
MLPMALFQILTIVADIIIFVLALYYFFRLREKEKLIEKERSQTDESYHHVVDDALVKERKIIEDAAYQASQIIAGTNYVTSSAKTTMDQAMKTMEGSLEQKADDASQAFSKSYSTSLQQVAVRSMSDFQTITHEMGIELQRQTKEFSNTLLPRLEQELEEYRKIRLQQADRTVTHIIQEVSQEILNKSISIEDHQRLLIDALEKAKKEGVFD